MGSIPTHLYIVESSKTVGKRFYYPARIVMGAGLPTRPCILRDAGANGCRISAETIHDVPDKFVLLLSPDGRMSRLCQTQWRFDNQIAVRFLQDCSAARPCVARRLDSCEI